MNKTIKMHFQYKDGSYDEIIVDSDDKEEIKKIHDNNNKIRREKYLKEKSESKFTIEEVEKMIGHEFASEDLNPLEQLIEMEKEKNAKLALELLAEAKKTLTKVQLYVYVLMVEKRNTSKQVAHLLNCSPQNVNKILRKAKKKISEFYKRYPEIVFYFPALLRYLED